MRLIIAGSRSILLTPEQLNVCIVAHFDISDITEVVSGCARGVDMAGIRWATKHGIPIKRFVPDWSQGKAAGHIRNREMGDYADAAIVIYDGKSKGSQGMIDYMKQKKKICFVIVKS